MTLEGFVLAMHFVVPLSMVVATFVWLGWPRFRLDCGVTLVSGAVWIAVILMLPAIGSTPQSDIGEAIGAAVAFDCCKLLLSVMHLAFVSLLILNLVRGC